MERITRLNSHFTGKKGSHIDDSIKFLNFDDSFFTPQINKYRLKLRKDLERNVAPYLSEMIEKAECVDKFVPILQKHRVGECYIQKPHGKGLDPRQLIATILELGRIDASLATFYLVQIVLFGNTIGTFRGVYFLYFFWIWAVARD